MGRGKGEKVPTQSALVGAKTTRPLLGCAAAPPNFQSELRVALTSIQAKVLELASNVPTQSALNGAKTTRLFGAIAAPENFLLVLMMLDTSTHTNAPLDAL